MKRVHKQQMICRTMDVNTFQKNSSKSTRNEFSLSDYLVQLHLSVLRSHNYLLSSANTFELEREKERERERFLWQNNLSPRWARWVVDLKYAS